MPELLDLLKSYEDRTRFRARRELRERPEQEVLSALDKWKDGLDKSDPEYWRQMLEALWLHQSLDDIDVPFLQQMLTCPEPRARAAATRVLCYWRDRISDTLELLRKQVNDEHPRVRLEAIRALSFFDGDQVAKRRKSLSSRCSIPRTITSNTPSMRPTKPSTGGRKTRARASENVDISDCGRSLRDRPPCPPLRKGGKGARHAARFEAILPDRSGAVRVLIALAAFALITPVVLADDPATPDSPLVKLLKSKRVPETRLGAIVDMIGKRGTAGDLDFIFQQATASDGFPTPIKVKALEALAEAASNRNLRPAKGRDGLVALIGAGQPQLEPDLEKTVVRLAGVWKLESAAEPLKSLAASSSTDDVLRALAPRCSGHDRRPGRPCANRGSLRAGIATEHQDARDHSAGKNRRRRRS